MLLLLAQARPIAQGKRMVPQHNVILRRLVPLLLFVTGVTGLVYEVVLGRLLAQHVGSSGGAQAVTLATFLGGMALGTVLAERLIRKKIEKLQLPLRGYALLEAFIGLWALLLPALSTAAFALFAQVAQGLDPGGAASNLAKLLLSVLLVAPLTIAMGATLPALASGVQRLEPSEGVHLVSRYYVLNAAGAALGAGLAGMWLVEAFGLHLPFYFGAVLNLAVALTAWLLSPRADLQQNQEAVRVLPRQPLPVGLALAALATGFVALSSEVLWTRLVALLLGSSAYAFSFMLVVTIAGIWLGSALASALLQRNLPPWRVLSASQALAGLGTVFLLVRLDRLPIQLAELRLAIPADPAHYVQWLLTGFAVMALHFLPAAMALGAAFPALLAAADQAGTPTDRATAQILGWNTLGNLLGALGCGFVLMPALGVESALCLGAILSITVSLLVTQRPRLLLDWAMPGVAALLVALALTLAMPDGRYLTRGLFQLRATGPEQVEPTAKKYADYFVQIFRKDGKDATISVNAARDGQMSLETNGKSDGGTGGDVYTQVFAGLIGLLYQPEATEAFMVGLGTGQSAGAMASAEHLHLQVVELSPAVVDAARLFAVANDDVHHNPRVRIDVADARDVLRTLPDHSLDIVVSEPSNPWVAGISDLFAAESFQRMAAKLRPHGVLVQWLQTYESSDETFKSVLCTMQHVFGHVAVFRMSPGDLALVGSLEPLQIDFRNADKVLQSAGVQRYLNRLQRPDVPTTLLEVLTAQLTTGQKVQQMCVHFTDLLQEERPTIEYHAPRDSFARQTALKATRTLDGRLGRTRAQVGDTELERYLHQQEMNPEEKQQLFQHLAAFNHTLDSPLGVALVPVAEWPAVLQKNAVDLADPLTATTEMSQQTCARLHQKLLWLLRAPQTVFGPTAGNSRLQQWAEKCEP